MLVILSGSETIHKKFFARRILEEFNVFDLDGYKLKFQDNKALIWNPDGLQIYGPGSGYDIQEGSKDIEIIQQAIKIQANEFYDGGMVNHFAEVFCDLHYDYGITDKIDYYGSDLLHPHSYQDVLKNYENKLGEVLVISGTFSKAFIDQIRQDLGEENVVALNIIRNPSVAYLLHKKEDEFYELGKNNTLQRTYEIDLDKFKTSIFNCVNLKRFDDVTTLKFEDIIADGKFTVNGVDITVPKPEGGVYNGYAPHNQWLTNWEYDNVVSQERISDADLAEFNTEFSDFIPSVELIAIYNQEKGASLTQADFKMIPKDQFKSLGYIPLDYDTIVG